MSDKHVSINIFDLIESICADFRRQWKSGTRPQIEDHLRQVPADARETLFRNLLPVDLRYRERAGEKPQPGDYLGQFPQHKRVIGDAFNYTTSIEIQAMGNTPVDDSAGLTATIEFPAANRIGDYELVRELGRGGFGVVYEAKHVTRRNRVALKTLPTGVNGQEINAERLHKFRREFRRLSEINHPNLVGMQTLEVDGSQWFFTMDLVEGVDFLSYVRPSGKLDESRLRNALKQLVVGVVGLHEQRILHRDLKPSNVLVSADGQVSILDFGLVAELEQRTDQTASMQTQHFAGTPRYAAPEQIFGQRLPATDWYAIGTMLFESLTGDAPYRGSAAELLIKKREEDAPPLAERVDLPTDLATLTDQLLCRAPEQRPAAEEIAEALALELGTVSHGSHGSHEDEFSSVHSLVEVPTPTLVGREQQLAQLDQARQSFLRSRQPEIVWIAGLSGEGKSSLADKFLASIRRSGEALVLSGRCYDRESVPFKAVDVLIEALVSILRSRPKDQVNGWLPRDIQMLARLFPTLRRIEPIADQPHVDFSNIDDRQIRYRAFFALRELLVRISRETPLVLFIDDLQWGDADSAEVLADLLAPPHPPAMLLLGSYRSDEAEESPFLREWKHRSKHQEVDLSGRVVEVAPLSEEQCLEFVAQRVGITADRLREQAQDMLADTKGNPYFLEQLIEGFNVETGQFDPVPLRDIVETKLGQLPRDARDLLTAIAIAGQAVSIEEASSVAGHDTSLFATVTHMRSERLVRLIGLDEQQLVDTYHDKIREALLDNLEKSSLRTWHMRFGELLEKQEQVTASDVVDFLQQDAVGNESKPPTNERIFDLAFHFYAAGAPRGWIYQLMAAEQSYRLYASEDAVAFLERAQRTLPADASDGIRYRLFHRLGTSYSRLGQFDLAVEAYQNALQFASSKLAKAHAYAGLGVVQQSQGLFTAATESNDSALIEIGRKRPKGIWAIIRMSWQLTCVFAIPARWARKPGGDTGVINNFELVIYENMGQYIFDQAESLIDYPYCLSRLGTLAKAVTEQDHSASGMTQFAAHIAVSGLPSIGQWLLKKRALKLEQIVNIESRGICNYMEGNILFGLVKLSTADERFKTAQPLLLQTGSHMFGVACAHIHRHLYHEIGTSSDELDRAQMVLRVAADVRDSRGQCWGHYDVAAANARRGEIEKSLQSFTKATAFVDNAELNLSESIYYGTKAYIYLQASAYQAAREAAEQAWLLVCQRRTIMGYTIRMFPWLIDSTVGPNWKVADNGHRRERLRSLRRTARLLSFFYPLLRAPLERMAGRMFWIQGNSKRAISCFEKAVTLSETTGNQYERARALLDLSAVRQDESQALRDEGIQLLKQMESVIPRAESWLLGDQHDESVVAPEFDLEAWEQENGQVVE